MTTENYSSAGKPLTLELFLPSLSGVYPIVLVRHGAFGLLQQYRDDIVSFSEALAKQGVAAALPHYLEATGSAPGLVAFGKIGARYNDWRRACVDGLVAIAADARFDASRIGPLGFSLGGNLALSLPLDPPVGVTFRGVADLFGPMLDLTGDWSRLPPLLICHGAADDLVKPKESEQLVAHLEAAGRVRDRDFYYEIYLGAGHGFKGAALKASRDRTIEFFSGPHQDE